MSLYFLTLMVICGSISIIASILILLKDKNEQLNQFLFATFFLWGTNVVLLGIIYGNLFDNEIQNFIRDIEISLGIMSGSFLLLAGLALKYGNRAQNKLLFLVIVVIDIILMIIAIPNDYVNSIDNEIISEPLGSLTIFLIPGILAFLGVFYFIQVYRITTEKEVKRKILYFILGTGFLLLGVGLLGIGRFLPIENEILRTISNIFYALGAINVFGAFQTSNAK